MRALWTIATLSALGMLAGCDDCGAFDAPEPHRPVPSVVGDNPRPDGAGGEGASPDDAEE